MQIYYLSLTHSTMDNEDIKLLNCISETRREKVLRYHFSIDQKLSLYAELLTIMCISNTLKIPYQEINIAYKELHKPILLSHPNIDFNYSHTKNAILLGITSIGKIGVDIEPITTVDSAIMAQVFHPEEINYVNSSSPSKRDNAFFEIWTKKEAYTKYLGIGFSANLTSINTLSPSLNSTLRTWQQDSYVCSTCCDDYTNYQFTVYYEDMIKTFFLHF